MSRRTFKENLVSQVQKIPNISGQRVKVATSKVPLQMVPARNYNIQRPRYQVRMGLMIFLLYHSPRLRFF